jgi:hypothetical protein
MTTPTSGWSNESGAIIGLPVSKIFRL